MRRALLQAFVRTQNSLSQATSPASCASVDVAGLVGWQHLVRHLTSYSVVPMPKLSHEMTQGTVTKWRLKPGDKLKRYDIIMELSTDELTPAEFKEGDFKGTVEMLIESQDEGVLAKILVDEGKTVKVGTPVALVCDSAKDAEALGDTVPDTKDVYDAKQESVTVLSWQSYLKSGKASSGGCMT